MFQCLEFRRNLLRDSLDYGEQFGTKIISVAICGRSISRMTGLLISNILMKKFIMQNTIKDLWEDFKEKNGQLPTQTEKELIFIKLASNGDIDRVKWILKNDEALDKNCVDEKGRTALRLAIKKQHLPVSIWRELFLLLFFSC